MHSAETAASETETTAAAFTATIFDV